MTLVARFADAVIAFATDIKTVLQGLTDHKESTTAHNAGSIEVSPPVHIGDGVDYNFEASNAGQALGFLNGYITQTKSLLGNTINNKVGSDKTGAPGGFPVLDNEQKVYEFFLRSTYVFITSEAELPATDSGKTIYIDTITKKAHYWNLATGAYVSTGGGGGEAPKTPLTLVEYDVDLPAIGEGTEGTIFIVSMAPDYKDRAFSWIPYIKVDPEDPDTWQNGYWREILQQGTPELPEITAADISVGPTGGANPGMIIGRDPYSESRYAYVEPALQALQDYVKSVDVVYWTTSAELQGLVNVVNGAAQRRVYITRDTAEIYIYDEVAPGYNTYAFRKLNSAVAAEPNRAVVGPDAPSIPGEFFWVQTDGNGSLIDIFTGMNA